MIDIIENGRKVGKEEESYNERKEDEKTAFIYCATCDGCRKYCWQWNGE